METICGVILIALGGKHFGTAQENELKTISKKVILAWTYTLTGVAVIKDDILWPSLIAVAVYSTVILINKQGFYQQDGLIVFICLFLALDLIYGHKEYTYRPVIVGYQEIKMREKGVWGIHNAY